jgi:hypothetical protein
VLVGVVLPTVDMSSDVYMVTEYIRSGEIGMAKAIIAMVFLCLLSQLMIVYAQTRRKPALMVREMLLTLLFMKPARDALRVAQGNERKVSCTLLSCPPLPRERAKRARKEELATVTHHCPPQQPPSPASGAGGRSGRACRRPTPRIGAD